MLDDIQMVEVIENVSWYCMRVDRVKFPRQSRAGLAGDEQGAKGWLREITLCRYNRPEIFAFFFERAMRESVAMT